MDESSWSWLSNAPIKPVPLDVKEDFDWTSDRWISIDVETHNLAPRRHERGWVCGDFGHNRLKYDVDEVRALRAVQIGWTIGDITADTPPVTKSRLIKPIGFEITTCASGIHGITNGDAQEHGDDLAQVLTELLHDVYNVACAGGRLCAHNLEFDATIIDAELLRVCMEEHKRVTWQQYVSAGLCTMNPILTKWCCEFYRNGLENNGDQRLNGEMPCKLQAVAWTLVPRCDELFDKTHDAGNDSRLCWLITKNLHRIIRDSADRST